MSFDFLSVIKNIAPMIAGTFGTPLLGIAVSELCKVLPADQATTVQAAHAADPVNGALNKLGELFQQGAISAAQIKQAEVANTERMAELGYKNVVDLAKITFQDRDSARKMQTSTKSRMPAILATVAVGGVLVIMVAMAFGMKLDGSFKDTFILGFGVLLGLMKEVYSFSFGDNAASQGKTATISEIAKQP